jgi:exopolysaccharide production protein ExoZ
MRTLISIQALRALAALAVAICHFDQVRTMLSGHADEPFPLFPLSAGVDVFFVISGFIMVYSSERLFAARGGSLEFLIRRLARIVPLYWLTTALAIWLMAPPRIWESLLDSYFFIPYRATTGNMLPLHGVGWTLNFEMFFYVLFALAITWRRGIAVSVLCATLTGIAAAGYWLKPSAAQFIFWSDPIILEFAAGMLIAEAYQRGARLPIILRWWLVPGALLTIWFVPEYMPPSGYRFLMWGVPAATLVACAVLGQRSATLRWFAAPAKLLGDASYALYLVHPLTGAVIFLLWHQGLNQYPMITVLVVAVILTQALSVGIFVFLERPCTRAIVNFVKRRPAEPAAVASHPL